MVDLQTVCCMCGDVGFPDKLFRCNKCRNRFQHSYCSNYYSEFSKPIELCDWCQSEEWNNARRGSSSKKSVAAQDNKSADKSKKHESSSGEKGHNKNQKGLPCPRTATRKYKLLKDVMC